MWHTSHQAGRGGDEAVSILSVMAEAIGRRDTRAPEGITVTVVTDREDLAVQAGPLVAKVLFPDRRFGQVLDVEAIEVKGCAFAVTVRDLGPKGPRPIGKGF